MTRFAVSQTVITREARVVVDAGLAPGRHRFRLVVSDDSGRASAPAEVLVQIDPPPRPTRPPRLTGNPTRRVLTKGPP